jgi:hypothetical protein
MLAPQLLCFQQVVDDFLPLPLGQPLRLAAEFTAGDLSARLAHHPDDALLPGVETPSATHSWAM